MTSLAKTYGERRTARAAKRAVNLNTKIVGAQSKLPSAAQSGGATKGALAKKQRKLVRVQTKYGV